MRRIGRVEILVIVSLKFKFKIMAEINIKGFVELIVRRKGKIINHIKAKNLIVSAGKAGLASRLNGSGAEDPFIYLALGSGTTPAVVGDTALETEITEDGLERVLANVSRITTNVANDTAKLNNIFTSAGTHSISEVGCFNASSGGTMLGRYVMSAIGVENGDVIEFNYKFVIS